MVGIISFFLSLVAAFIAYRTYKHQQGEVLLRFLNLPHKKSIKDDVFEENFENIKLKITNASNFPISIDSVYCVLSNPDYKNIFDCQLNESFTRKLSNVFSKNILLETGLNELHVNLISNPIVIESSKSITVSLTPNLIGENLSYKFIEDGKDFFLLIKNIYIKNETGKKWEISSSDALIIQEFTASLYYWKISRDLIESMISYYKAINELSGEEMTEEETRAKAIHEAENELGL